MFTRFKISFLIIVLNFLLESGKLHAQNIHNEIFSWGWNHGGQLGINSTSNKSTPQKINNSNDWKQISAGYGYTTAIKNDSSIWVWGQNQYGQLGLGNNTFYYTPQKIGSNRKAIMISGSFIHTLAIFSDSTLWGWGHNLTEELGIGNNINANSPTQIGTDKNWKWVAAGYHMSFAIKSNGTLWAWGSNSGGELGLGHSNSVNSPEKVGNGNNWVKVDCGSGYVIALKNDGTLWACGGNSVGNLGLGNTTSVNLFTQIGTDNDWIDFDCGYMSNLAIKSDGTLWGWGANNGYNLGNGNRTDQAAPIQIGLSTNWIKAICNGWHSAAINTLGELWTWGSNRVGQLGNGSTTQNTIPSKLNSILNVTQLALGYEHTIALQTAFNEWNGTSDFSSTNNWTFGHIPSSTDSVIIKSGALNINQSTTLDIMTVLGGSTVKLEAPLTLRNLHIKNGTIDLNGYKLTVTGRIYQSTDSTNYYIQAGTTSSPRPRSELVIKPTTAVNSTLYFNPSANRLNNLEIGNGTAAAQITLANAVKIKGGEDGGTGPGLLTVNKNAKIIIANGSSLTLESDTFNAGLSLAQPAQRSIVCQGTGKFNIERDHFGARGWRLYAHPFNTDIDLQEVANDIELIGSGGTAEGFYSNTHLNASAYWYDYSKADSSATSDPAWTAFTSAKGSTISGNTNKWNKNSPLLLFNPGNRRGTDAFGSPSTATYEQGKINLSYSLDSTVVHLNDGTTQYVNSYATNWSKYLFITNPFTSPIRLCRIGNLNSDYFEPYFYYWKQRRNSLTNNFTPADWEAELIRNGNATRDSNIAIPPMGTILVKQKYESVYKQNIIGYRYYSLADADTARARAARFKGLPKHPDDVTQYWIGYNYSELDNFWFIRIYPDNYQYDSVEIPLGKWDTFTVSYYYGDFYGVTLTIPESAKQLTNFDEIIGGAKGISKTGQMFLDASASDVGNNGLEIKLLVNDSQEADRVLVYNEPLQSSGFTTADARKYLNQDFPNIFTLSSDGKPLALDMQDIKAELDAGKPEVAIPLAVNREANKRFPSLKWEITANTTGLDAYLRNRENGSTELWSVGDIKTVAFQSTASEIRNYELVFKRNSSSAEDLTQKPSLTKDAPIELLVYPNPVDDQLQLKVINSNGEIAFHIYSITGVMVMEGAVKLEKIVNTAYLNAGVYVIDAGGAKVKFVKK